MNAAASEWVRERERAYALKNAGQDGSFGILPVFRDDKDEVTKEMVRLARKTKSATPLSEYDLGKLNGYLVDPQEVQQGRLGEELRAAAECVLRSLLLTLSQRREPGERLRIGAATRNGPALRPHELDLLLDWTYDYPEGLPPSAAEAEANLSPALDSLGRALAADWGRVALQIVPQCHLTMALALGFRFRRNTGYDLEVMDPYSGTKWSGPARPLQPAFDLWDLAKTRSLGTGNGLAVVVGVAQAIDKDIETYASSSGLDAGKMIVFEPKQGPSMTALDPTDPSEPHRMAVAIAETVAKEQSAGWRGPVHLFVRVPAPFAVLIGQQLSNLGPVQTYEWKDSQTLYTPRFRFFSS